MTTYYLSSDPMTKNRRVDPRVPLSRTSISHVKLAAGDPVQLVNVSRSGALLEGNSRMRPGMRVTLQVKETDQAALVCGRVIRCSIVSVAEGALRYRFAVAFDKPIDFQIMPGEAAPEPSASDAVTPVPDLPPVPEEPAAQQYLNSW
jgi:hypothetical protein